MIYKPSTFNIVVAAMSMIFGFLLYLSLEQSEIFTLNDTIRCFTFIIGGAGVLCSEIRLLLFSKSKYSNVLYTSFIGLFMILLGNIMTVLRNIEYGYTFHNYNYLTRSVAFMLLSLYIIKTISEVYTSLVYYKEIV